MHMLKVNTGSIEASTCCIGSRLQLVTGAEKLCVLREYLAPPVHDPLHCYMVFGNYYTCSKPGATELFLIVSIGTALLVGVAFVVMVVYDILVRRYLSSKRRQWLG